MLVRDERVIALGFFDGVHIGHGGLVRMALRRAAESGARACVLTFDSHPENLVVGRPVPLISSREDRAGILLRVYGVGEVLVAHFDEHMMHMPWDSFIGDYLVSHLGAVHLVAGHDFRFGYRGQGNPELLRRRCAELGIGCDIIAKIELDGITVSSSYIRGLIEEGDMERAGRFLGHPHCLSAPVVHGKQLGRQLGTPTANMLIPETVLTPAFGVYAAKVALPDGTERPAVVNVGVRPTVGDAELPTVEPYILDFSGDLYGQTIRVDFYKRLRGEQKFASLDELAAQIRRDEQATREFFAEKN